MAKKEIKYQNNKIQHLTYYNLSFYYSKEFDLHVGDNSSLFFWNNSYRSGMANQQTEATNNLTEEQTEQCEIFKLFADTNGFITTEQLGDVMRYVGVNPTKAELANMIKEIGSKEIDREKFLELMAKQKQAEENIREELMETFKIFDKANTGTVSRQELRHVLTSIGEQLTEDEIEEMIKEADVSQDGKLVIEEFVKLLLAK